MSDGVVNVRGSEYGTRPRKVVCRMCNRDIEAASEPVFFHSGYRANHTVCQECVKEFFKILALATGEHKCMICGKPLTVEDTAFECDGDRVGVFCKTGVGCGRED